MARETFHIPLYNELLMHKKKKKKKIQLFQLSTASAKKQFNIRVALDSTISSSIKGGKNRLNRVTDYGKK